MGRKSERDRLLDAIRVRLREMDHSNAGSTEEAVANEQTICNVFGMRPTGADAYDMCPTHPAVVRFRGQCSECNS
jgi:hypothetical protein